ncbi:MAG: hypothetical protein H0V92_05045 [Pseudonocardiales bacterium]|nr:hypothetical protein [Pseudonocardiales bacterium]
MSINTTSGRVRGPLPHAHEAVPAAEVGVGVRRPCAAVVHDLDPQLTAAVLEGHLDPGRVGVFQRVGQRLLDDPVRAQVHHRRQRLGLADDLHGDRQPHLAKAVDQFVEVGQRRLRLQLGGLAVLAQQPQ